MMGDDASHGADAAADEHARVEWQTHRGSMAAGGRGDNRDRRASGPGGCAARGAHVLQKCRRATCALDAGARPWLIRWVAAPSSAWASAIGIPQHPVPLHRHPAVFGFRGVSPGRTSPRSSAGCARQTEMPCAGVPWRDDIVVAAGIPASWSVLTWT
jgi:hypothetical protein